MLLLVLLAAIGLGPERPRSLGPVPTPPRFEAAVGGGEALGVRADVAVARRVAVADSTSRDRSPGGPQRPAGATPVLTVGPARAVAVVAVPDVPGPEPTGTGDEVPSVGATDGEAPPEGTSSPVATPLPSTSEGSPGGPIAAGGPAIESCEGDEYVITIVLAAEAIEGEESTVEIVLRKLNDDGSVEELRLEGDLLDARNLGLQLSSEGNCVYLEAGPAAGEGVPSDGTSQVVVPTEGTPSPVPAPAQSGAEPGAP
jgi:hypothetical protein